MSDEFIRPLDKEMFPSVLRKFAWDIFPCEYVNQFMPAINMTPASDEGWEAEHKDSHRRVGLQVPLEDIISVYAAFAARVEAALVLRLDKNSDKIEDKYINAITFQYADVIEVGTRAIVAHLLDEGYIQLGPKAAS